MTLAVLVVLQEMSRACKADGQILLLEHGMGTSPWINKMLHDGAEKHLKHWGCQWDRDIEDIVKQVRFQLPPVCILHDTPSLVIAAAGKIDSCCQRQDQHAS